eukprot:3383361-Pyramimonas_sp.AAC.1
MLRTNAPSRWPRQAAQGRSLVRDANCAAAPPLRALHPSGARAIRGASSTGVNNANPANSRAP